MKAGQSGERISIHRAGSIAITLNSSVSTKASRVNRAPFLHAQARRFEAWVIKNSGWLAVAIVIAGCAVRIAYAGSCYLNPDEALHFDAARSDSWLSALRASYLLAHPPLFILALHAFLFLGHSEIILRSLSVITGTTALGLSFAWIRRSLGALPALAGLLFLSISPAAISASIEVRQYGLLLCFICGALYAAERAMTEQSLRWTIVLGFLLLGALLTHYTATVAILTIDLYFLLRCLFDRIPRRLVLVFVGTQIVLAAVLAWLYFSQIRQSRVLNPAGLFYLKQSFYQSGSESLIEFARRAFSGTFGYLCNRKWPGLSILVLIAGLAALLTGRPKAKRLQALLVVSPFVMGFFTAVFHVFPFTGSRHQTYLLPFLAMGLSAALAWMPRGLGAPSLLLGAILAPHWVSNNPPDNNPRLFRMSNMTEALTYIGQTIPPNAPLFMDSESRLVLGYYLQPIDPDASNSPRESLERLGRYRVLEPTHPVWSFGSNDVLAQANDSARTSGIPPNDTVWIISVGWSDHVSLASRLPAEDRRTARDFGTLSVIKTTRD